jgi:hypothetical protein
MIIGFHAHPSAGFVPDVARGLEAARHRVRFQRAEVFTADQVDPSFDLVIVNGLRWSGRAVSEAYSAAGVPVIVADAAHLRRDRQYIRLTLGDHTWKPPFDCPGDRFDELDIDVARKRHKGSAILIAGQLAEDSSHNLKRGELQAWMVSTAKELRKHTDRDLIWRPHPADEWDVGGTDAVHWPSSEPLVDSLAESWAVVTYNSTIGLDALAAGIPVFTTAPSIYDDCACFDLSEIETASLPSYDDRVRLFRRIAYTQWQMLEVRTSAPIDFLSAIVDDRDPFAERDDWTAASSDDLAAVVSAPVLARLEKVGLTDRDALVGATDDDLLAIRGIGPKTVSMLREVVA